MNKKGKKSKDLRKAKPTKEAYPFVIHADPLRESTAYPTHTHGLKDVGMPEFLIDPAAFGPQGNAGRINASYRYFSKPKNAKRLKAILNGQIVKLTSKDLSLRKGSGERLVYCYREVTPDFEAVKVAYGPAIDPSTRFIQIWVEGDDFALEGDYYRGGVKWPG